MNLLRLFTLLLGALSVVGADAQSAQQLEAQFQQVCSPSNLARHADLRPQCDMMRHTLDQMRQSAAPKPGRAPTLSEQLDNTTQCACTRKLGRCSASAHVSGQDIGSSGNGLSSRVVVRINPPAGQCVEVTAFLQETALFGGRLQRTGHPLYAVLRGPTDVEWRNLSTPASQLQYEVLSADTECHVCDAKRGGSTPPSDDAAAEAEGAAAARADVRAAGEKEWRGCMAGTGDLYRQMAPSMRLAACAWIRKEVDQLP